MHGSPLQSLPGFCGLSPVQCVGCGKFSLSLAFSTEGEASHTLPPKAKRLWKEEKEICAFASQSAVQVCFADLYQSTFVSEPKARRAAPLWIKQNKFSRCGHKIIFSNVTLRSKVIEKHIILFIKILYYKFSFSFFFVTFFFLFLLFVCQ
jgi:hypothetical protein